MRARIVVASAVFVIAFSARAFTPGNIVVYRFSIANATAAAVYLDEFTPDGLYVGSTPMPIAFSGPNSPLTANGGDTNNMYEGMMTRSVNREFLIVPGYAAVPGTAVAFSNAATVPRVVGRVAADGTIDTSTALTDWASGGKPISAGSGMGTGFLVSGTTSGIRYTVKGDTGSADQGANAVNIGALFLTTYETYYSAGTSVGATVGIAGIFAGTVIPTTPDLFAPRGFAVLDLDGGVAGDDTIYVATLFDGVKKFSKVGGSWVLNGSINAPGCCNEFVGLTAAVSGSNVTLFVTDGASLLTYTDTTGYNGGFSGTLTAIANAPAGSTFRGVAWAPDPPHVVSVERASASPSNASSVDFNVTFSEPVSGVDAADFALTTSGVSGASLTNVSGSGAAYTVTVNTGSGNGTVRLDLIDDDSIASPVSGVLLGGAGTGNGNFTGGEVYSIDKTAPTVNSVTRADGSPTAAAAVNFNVTFSEAVTGIDPGDFTLSPTVTGAAITNISGSGAAYVVTVGTGSGDGSLKLNVIHGNGIADAAGNQFAADFTTGQTYAIDHTIPVVSSITPLDANPSKTNSVHYNVVFSVPVNGVDATDFAFTTTGGVTSPSITEIATVDNTTYTVTTTSSGEGTLRLDVVNNGTIQAIANSAILSGGFTQATPYTFDHTSPYVVSIHRANDTPTRGPAIAFTVTFSENVSGVDAGDFGLTTTGLAGQSIIGVIATGNTATVTVNVGAGVGTLRLDLVSNGTIVDAAGNPTVADYETGEVYDVDTTPRPRIVIAQMWAGSVSQGAMYGNDFIEIFNRDTVPVALNGWSVQVAVGATASWQLIRLPNVTLSPGQSFLIQHGNALGPFLPPPDLITTGVGIAAFSGKIAIVDNANPLPTSAPLLLPSVVDFLGYGSTDAFETAPAPSSSATLALARTPRCQDTGDNSADFIAASPSPRNSASTIASCNGVVLPAAPANVAAGLQTLSSAVVTWTASAGAQSYEVLRNGALIGTAAASPFTDPNALPQSAYVYSVRALNSGLRSQNSPPAVVTTFVYSALSKLQAQPVYELRNAVTSLRYAAGMPPVRFTDPALAGLYVKRDDIIELRTALDAARSLLGLPPLTYSTITAGTTTVQAQHIIELRF